MNLLQQIWIASIVLSLAALVTLIVLLVLRLRSDYLAARWKRERRDVVTLLLAPWSDANISQLRIVMQRSPDRVAALVVELLQLVRGDERDDLRDKALDLRVDAILNRDLRRGSPRIRLLAAEAMADFDDTRMVQRLRAALKDSSQEVRMAAAIALAGRSEIYDIPDLIERLGLNTRIPSRLTFSLFWLLAERQPQTVAALLENPEYTYRVRIPAIEALAASADFALVPRIVSMSLNTPTDDISQAAFQDALSSFGHPLAEPAVQRALHSEKATVRVAAVKAAARIGLVRLLPEIRTLLGDAEFMVRLRAAECLLKFGDKGLEIMREVARSGMAGEREAATRVLEENGLAL